MHALNHFDPLSPEFRANPYPYYDILRASAPIFNLPEWNMWFVTRHEDCMALMRDNRLGHEILRVMEPEELGWDTTVEVPEDRKLLGSMQRKWMLFSDPPGHTRLRGLVHKAFTPRMIEQLRGQVEKITAKLLDEIEAKGELELVEDYAAPLPVTVIAQMLGVPVEDQSIFRAWSDDLAGSLDLLGGEEGKAVFDRAAQAAVEFDAYFRDLAAKRRENPQDDLLTALVQAEDDGETLTEEELIATCILLLVAGHETTVNLIGNGTLALLRNPDQLELFKQRLDDDDFVKNAVEELLRYDPPVQMTTRWVLEDIDYAGYTFKKGQQVAVMFAAANHDPERFDKPDQLDITRENIKHMAFGNGIHFCLGAPLARMEGQIALRELFRRYPDLQLTDVEPEHRPAYVLRGLKQLNLTF